jgi:di/tricarboxylate transporter
MKLRRRGFLRLMAAGAALPVASRIARALTYPSRTVTMIVPFAAGGGPMLLPASPPSTCRARSDSR